MKKFCIVANSNTRANECDVAEICSFIESRGGSCVQVKNVENEETRFSGEFFIDPETVPSDVECAIILGGDGTILQSARQLAPNDIPILGINLGTVGFLAGAERNELYSTVRDLLNDRFYSEKRLLLSGSVISHGREIYKSNALNDIVVARSGVLRVISTEILIDEVSFNRFCGDGIIVSTPTGSTGYNLSAGGPILMPGTRSFAVTPICPHGFSDRGLVAPCTSRIQIVVVRSKKSQEDEAIVSFDGNRGIKINTGDLVSIKMADEVASFIRPEGYNFLKVLKNKMI